MIQTVTVEKEFSGNRVDKFLSEQFPDLSRSYIQKLIKDGHVTANGKIVKANYTHLIHWLWINQSFKSRILCQRISQLIFYMRMKIF